MPKCKHGIEYEEYAKGVKKLKGCNCFGKAFILTIGGKKLDKKR